MQSRNSRRTERRGTSGPIRRFVLSLHWRKRLSPYFQKHRPEDSRWGSQATDPALACAALVLPASLCLTLFSCHQSASTGRTLRRRCPCGQDHGRRVYTSGPRGLWGFTSQICVAWLALNHMVDLRDLKRRVYRAIQASVSQLYHSYPALPSPLTSHLVSSHV